MTPMNFYVFVVVAVSAVYARPFDIHGKDGSLIHALHEKLHKHFHDVDYPGASKIGGSAAQSKASAGSIAGNYGKGSLSAATASSSSMAKNEDYHHKYGGHTSEAKGVAASEVGHYDKEHDHYPSKTASLTKSGAVAESSAANYYMAGIHESHSKAAAASEAVSINVRGKDNYKPASHYFDEKLHGDDPHVYSSAEAKAIAKSASYGKKGAAHAEAESKSKAVSNGGDAKSFSKSVATAESHAAVPKKEHYFHDEPQGDDPRSFTFASSQSAAEAVSHGFKGDAHAEAVSDSKAVSYGGKGKSEAKSSALAESSSAHLHGPEGHGSHAKASSSAKAVSKSHDGHHYFNDEPQGAFSSAESEAAAGVSSYGKKDSSFAAADSEAKAVSYGKKGNAGAKSDASAVSAVVGKEKHHYDHHLQGDDPYAFNLAASKAASEAVSIGKKAASHSEAGSAAKSIGGKYFKGSSSAAASSKAESYSGYGVSGAAAASKSTSISA
ncbi:uncharacterized protein LOC124155032 [Ischnura elegans]|uniref:uncharacterized protein LOC124155032 n=1 Tax=Ischnura elegans TaxID=197161 RepID=UPI001ED877D5|nr:uncharacterized protein LOC124155032 [Ischnura elegans]